MKKVLAILLTLAMALSLSVTAFAADIVLPASGSELTDSNNSYEEDLTVTYSYTAPDTTAEKVFNVTVAFTLPTNMELEYTDTQNVYTWDHEAGKYVLDTTNSTEAAGTLTDEGEFTITVTNRSNVPVEFDVAYAANTAAVFASEVTYTTDYENIALDTVADGQEIGETGISITDVTAATTANTTFASADCTGKLSVTGINSGKTPGESGTDTLGTFTVTIGEATATDPLALGNNAVEGMTVKAVRIDWGGLEGEDLEMAKREYEEFQGAGELEQFKWEYPQVIIEEVTVNAGDPIPTDCNCEITYGDYTYSLDKSRAAKEHYDVPDGWSVNVVDKTKTSYQDIATSIAGLPIVGLDFTFDGCDKMTVAPAIPNTVKSYWLTFNGCSSLTTVSSPIYVGGSFFSVAFSGCSSLTGEIELVGTPRSFTNAFAGAGSENGVYLTGTCDSDVLAQMAGQSEHVFVK